MIDPSWLSRIREGLAGRTPAMPPLVDRMTGKPGSLKRRRMTKPLDRILRRFGYVHKSSITIEGTLRGGRRVHGDLHRI